LIINEPKLQIQRHRLSTKREARK